MEGRQEKLSGVLEQMHSVLIHKACWREKTFPELQTWQKRVLGVFQGSAGLAFLLISYWLGYFSAL